MANAARLLLGFALIGTLAGAEDVASSCASTAGGNDYNMSLHIASIFILMAVSGAGIFTSLTLGTYQNSPKLMRVLQIFKMFGIGVIAATAWCHLLTDAYAQFSNPCLDQSWQGYGANFVGVFALAASFAIQLIELMAVGHAKHRRTASDLDPEPSMPDSLTAKQALPASHGHNIELEGHYHEDGAGLSTLILEAGILFHSLIIGITLGVTVESSHFQTLLIAVCFHQMFEGLALGALIANLKRGTLFKFLVLGLLYPMVTPIGIAIGIGWHSSYNDNSTAVIVVQGIFDSLSGGILMYNTYCELMSVEINHNRSFRKFSRRFKVVNMVAMYLGAAAMAILAYWA
ncbi:hypothetical protein PBRA_005405 [Plasmodiophora brassicae]|nr:hypothetical protein PBRA_005405 [Plasmodiophora brassicae]